MKWTTTPPTVAGWYWCAVRGVFNMKTYPTIVKVYASDPKNPVVDYAVWDGENVPLTDSHFIQWGSEPITEPKEGI